MTNRSALRQLARRYYDGEISRKDYKDQRHDLISSIESGAFDGLGSSDDAVTARNYFEALEEPQPDSADLASALAKREPSAVDGASISKSAVAEPESHPSSGASKDKTQRVQEKPRWGRRLLVFIVLVAMLCAGIVATVFYSRV